MRCALCKKEVYLPYLCSYCGQYFCDDHRLPEQHMCPGLPKRSWFIFRKLQRKEKIITSKIKPINPARDSYPWNKTSPPSSRVKKKKTMQKVNPRLIMLLIIIGVGLIFYIDNPEEFGVRLSALPSKITSIFSQASNEVSSMIEESEQESRRTRQEFLKEIELLILEYTNQERTSRGLNELRWDDDLSKIARKHSQDMAENDYFSHTNLDGDGPSERAKKQGYDTYKELGGGWYTDGIGENIGMMPTGNVEGKGYVSNDPDSIAKAQVESWMDSQGHRANILDPDYDKLGVGVSYDGLYYISTQDFW